MTKVAHIWRHPIKSHGTETLDSVELEAGRTMPWDRRWAVAHDASKADSAEWAPCVNFTIGSKAPKLMAIKARSNEETGLITLNHPDLPPFTFNPDTDSEAFLDWVKPLVPSNRAQSARVVRVPGRGMTDTDFPSISIANLASHAQVAEHLDQEISPLRWRANIWLEGLKPWEEFEWLGQRFRVGTAEFEIKERIKRCLATTANPETGERDADTLGALNAGWDHQDFGVYAEVVTPGRIALGDNAELL